MSKCHNLSRLPKTTLLSHVHFHRQHPGDPVGLLRWRIEKEVLDPTHPATRSKAKNFPFAVEKPYFLLRAYPNALLSPKLESVGAPSWPKVDTWADRVARASSLSKGVPTTGAPNPPDLAFSAVPANYVRYVTPPTLLSHPKGSIPMSLYFSVGKAKVHNHCVKRRRLRTKIRTAIDLIVTRGAYVDEATKELKFNEEEVQERGNKWILPDWAYLCVPNSEVYLASYPDLVTALRSSLQGIWTSGMRLEADWAKAEMKKVVPRVKPTKYVPPTRKLIETEARPTSRDSTSSPVRLDRIPSDRDARSTQKAPQRDGLSRKKLAF